MNEIIQKLQSYHWPGNIRELSHTIERTMIMNESLNLKPADFVLSITDSSESEWAFENYNLAEMEKLIIRKVLNKNNENISRAAKELGLTRTSLYRRMEKYDL